MKGLSSVAFHSLARVLVLAASTCDGDGIPHVAPRGLPMECFVQRLARHEKSGRISTATFHVVRRACVDTSAKVHIHNISKMVATSVTALCGDGLWVGTGWGWGWVWAGVDF